MLSTSNAPGTGEIRGLGDTVAVEVIDLRDDLDERGAPARRWHRAAKRAIDVVGALTLLVLLLPVLAVAAAGVKVTSPGPVLFRQVRLGRNGRLFTLLKFRTFPTDHRDTEVALPVEACPLPFGRFLRRTSIDELPQLLNVLLGHMSLVGPRPERPRFAAELATRLPHYMDRLRAPAGITGLAQVRGLHGTSSLEARVAADNEYIDSWTLWSDVRILAATVPAVVRKARATVREVVEPATAQ